MTTMPLISTNHSLYLRRLVRELNAQVNGFYAPVAAHTVRCNRARIKAGELQVRSPFTQPEWFAPSRPQFTDPYGREIVASRKPVRRAT